MSARKRSVPTPRRIRAKTSFHALLFTGRATFPHSNAAMSPFNFIPVPIRDWMFGVGPSAFSASVGFPSCAVTDEARSVPDLMRSYLRKTALVLATASLVFFLSCERHHVGELEGHTEGDLPHQHDTT